MPSTHLSLHYHLVFSTKHREPWFAPSARHRIHEYLGGIIRNMDGIANAVGGTGDHVHLAVGLKATHRLSDVMRELKSESSRWVHEELKLRGFAWQEGYGAFTFAAPDLEPVRKYVLTQEEHHRAKTFQDEYVEMLNRGLVEYDDVICGERGVGQWGSRVSRATFGALSTACGDPVVAPPANFRQASGLKILRLGVAPA